MITETAGRRNPVRLLLYVPVPWVFVLTYLVGVALEYLLPLKADRSVPLSVTVAGGLLFCLGAVIAGWGWLLFHQAGTTRIPGQPSTALVTSGPYRVSRNPMYVGLTLAYLGEAGLLGQLWPVLLLPLTLAHLNWTVIPVEEARLKEVFGTDYDRYRAAVRRWI